MTRVVLVKAVLDSSTKMVDLPGQVPLQGYYQRFGVSGQSFEEIVESVRSHVRADIGAVIASVEDLGDFDPLGAHSDIPERPTLESLVGIWHVGGRAFYRAREQ